MLDGLLSRLKDMGAIERLCRQAEAHALRDGRQEPGAEHFLLAAFDLGDGTARAAFARVGADPANLLQAIEQQYSDALRAIGFPAPGDSEEEERLDAKPGLYRAAPSGQHVMQALAASRKTHRPLLGAHVVAIVADMPHGVAARALRRMGVEPANLKFAAESVVSETRGA